MRFATSVAFAVAMIVSASAMAAEPAHPVLDSLKQACAADTKQFCPNVEPGQGRIVKCLRDNEDKLSQPCKDARAAARANIQRKSAPE